MTTKYNNLKEIIKTTLLANPEDLLDTITLETYETREWESVSERDFSEGNTRKIGASNLLECLQIIADICVSESSVTLSEENLITVSQSFFQSILKDLEEEGVIRVFPELKRNNLKIVDNAK